METEQVEMNATSDNDIGKQVARNEIERIQKALDKALDTKQKLPKVISDKKKLLDISKKAQKIQLDKFVKLNYEFEYEKDEDFHKLMKEKQKVLNSLNNFEQQNQIKTLENQLSEVDEHIEYYEQQIKFKKEQFELED